MNSNYRQNNFIDQVQGITRNNQAQNEQQFKQAPIFQSPTQNPYLIGNPNIPNIQLNQNQNQQNYPIQRNSHQSNNSGNASVVSQDQQMMQMFNNMMNFFVEKGMVDPKQLNQMTPRTKNNIEQMYRQEQQNYFMQQMQSINNFYQQLNTQNTYDPQDYQQQVSRKDANIQQRQPHLYQPFQQSGQKQQQQFHGNNEMNYYLKNIQSPSQNKNQNYYQQMQQMYGQNLANQSLDNVSSISGGEQNNNYIPNPMNYNINGSNIYQNPHFINLNNSLEQQLQYQNYMKNGSPTSNNQIYNYNYNQGKPQNIDKQERAPDYANSNGQRLNTVEEGDVDRNMYKQQEQQRYQQYLIQQMQEQQQQNQKQRRLLDYDEIFNLSSNQGDSLANTQNMANTQQNMASHYDNMQINTKYHQDNLKANQNPHQVEQGQQSLRDFDDQPIHSMGATKNFEELIEEEMKKNNLKYEDRFLNTEQEKIQKKRGDTPQFREGSVGNTSKRNKTESPQRFLKQGEGKGGRTTSVSHKDKNSKKSGSKKRKQDSIDESLQFQKFEEILQEISEKKTDISTDDILKIQQEEQNIIEIRGEKVRLDNIEISEQLEKVLITKYVNNKIDDLNFYIKKFQASYQKARVFKQNYEENIKKFDFMKQNFEEKMKKERSEFEDYKAEQKKLIEAEYRLVKKIQQEKLAQASTSQKPKDSSADRDEEGTMKSLLRYKEEVKSLRDKLGRLQFDSKKKIEELHLSLNNTIKDNRKLRKELNVLKKQLEQCEDLKYIVSPAQTIKEDPSEDQDKSSNEREKSQERKGLSQDQIRMQESNNGKIQQIQQNGKLDKKNQKNRQPSPPSSISNISALKKQSEKINESTERISNQAKKEVEKQTEIKQTSNGKQSEISAKKGQKLSENLKEQTSKLKSLINPKINNYKTPKLNEEQKQQNPPQEQNEVKEQKKNIPRQQPSSGSKNEAKPSQNGQQAQQQVQQDKNNNNNTNSNVKPSQVKKTPLSRYQSLKQFTIEEIGKNIDISEFKYSTNKYYIKYQQFQDQTKKPQHVENNKDGSITSTYEKGIKEIVYKNKTRQVSFIDGYQIVIFPTGDIKQVFPNNIEQYFFSSNQATQTTLLEGQTIVLFSNNQIELTLQNGAKQIRYPEGIMKINEQNGDEKLIYPNGIVEVINAKKIKTIKYPDGSSKTVYPDNTVVQGDDLEQN
ncbi:hypothetical protein ABPG74_010569 [Tetrahymena malaccensis]